MTITTVAQAQQATPLSIEIDAEFHPSLVLSPLAYNQAPQFSRRLIAGKAHVLKMGKWHKVLFIAKGAAQAPQALPVVQSVGKAA